MKNYCSIILAAGYSSRMGKFKPLMNLCGRTPLQRCIDLFRNLGIEDIIVVTGCQNDLVGKEIKGKAAAVYNDKFDEGMFSSIKAGISKLPKYADAFFVLPSDIPSVKENTVKMLIQSFEESGDIIFPTFHNDTGHPVLISNSFSHEILFSNPKGGLRDILNLHKGKWKYAVTADRGILLDMDNADDFNLLCEHVSSYPYPDFEECMEMLRLCNVNEDTVEHMKAVADLAKRIAILMNERGCSLNLNAVYSGAILHDIAKGRHNHEAFGAEIVKGFGYDALSSIISEHMKLNTLERIGEKEIVYICDKLIKGTKMVTLDERFEGAFKRYKDEPQILNEVQKKYLDAKTIKEEIEKVLNINLENLRWEE